MVQIHPESAVQLKNRERRFDCRGLLPGKMRQSAGWRSSKRSFNTAQRSKKNERSDRKDSAVVFGEGSSHGPSRMVSPNPPVALGMIGQGSHSNSFSKPNKTLPAQKKRRPLQLRVTRTGL